LCYQGRGCGAPRSIPGDGGQTDVTGWPKACMLGLLCEDKDIQNHECYLKVK
jgi:hypothetical protein